MQYSVWTNDEKSTYDTPKPQPKPSVNLNPYGQESFKKFQVVILMDDEKRKSCILEKLSGEPYRDLSTLCSIPMPTNSDFTYKRYGLVSEDDKLTKFAHSRDGIIFLLDAKKYNPKFEQRIKHIAITCPKKIPIMIYIENGVDNKYNFNDISINKFVKYFIDETPVSVYSSVTKANDWFVNKMNTMNVTEGLSKPTEVKTLPKLSELIKSDNDKIIIAKVKQFLDCTLPLEEWDHKTRLMIVYYSLRKYGLLNSLDKTGWLCTSWKMYKESIGHADLWHYTLTCFWVKMINRSMSRYPDFESLYVNNKDLQSGRLFTQYYSNEVLFTDLARNSWIAPNIKSIWSGELINKNKQVNKMKQIPINLM
ncbi:MAG: hypothetical protein Terrestrivirus2_238 [Terrestrivirus sp.]|uniref:Uncharacterized protein n=1 Tax=Terrestrivirus sp. TaxID=2487775 RepID=A0A3G4ZLJ6_9VIRU|nr:MAG: hypothetical protein Terrestrivirus2_238 [Terrestrivirus sp.]